jgi:hypothetical protein
MACARHGACSQNDSSGCSVCLHPGTSTPLCRRPSRQSPSNRALPPAGSRGCCALIATATSCSQSTTSTAGRCAATCGTAGPRATARSPSCPTINSRATRTRAGCARSWTATCRRMPPQRLQQAQRSSRRTGRAAAASPSACSGCRRGATACWRCRTAWSWSLTWRCAQPWAWSRSWSQVRAWGTAQWGALAAGCLSVAH